MVSRNFIFWEVDVQADFMLPGGKLSNSVPNGTASSSRIGRTVSMRMTRIGRS